MTGPRNSVRMHPIQPGGSKGLNCKKDAFPTQKKFYFYLNSDLLNSRLKLLFDSLETERHRLLEKVSKLSTDRLHHAEPGKWSAEQILAHLIAAERISTQYMNKKILGIQETEDTGALEELKMVLLKVSQRLPLKFKAPRAVLDNTHTYGDLHQLHADWDNERAELKSLLEKFNDSQIKKKVYRHIRAGRLNIQHALIFFQEHSLHHWPQIKRLL
jgi:DinB superfamily